MDDIDLFSLSENELSKFRRKHFGFVFQQFNLIPNFNVKENIELPLLFDKRKINTEMPLISCCAYRLLAHM